MKLFMDSVFVTLVFLIGAFQGYFYAKAQIYSGMFNNTVTVTAIGEKK